ncbi:MAG: O-antigen ligase family protein, partial [Pirellulaceae bacterium]|nr:O-antigen ligase family protein [Pirellulaceae bacterium]
PSLAERLPLWSNDANSAVALGNWSTISLAPDSTRGALVVYLAYALLFVLLLQRLQTLDDVERLLKLIAVAAVAMAALGLAQYLVNNGKFLWFYEHPSRTTEFRVKGTFHNQNHFAHFLALGVGPLIWWIVRAAAPGSDRSSRSGWSGGRRVNPLVRQGLIVAAGVVGVAVLLSFSRGGVIAVAIAAATCLGVYFWRKLLTRKSLIPIALTAAAVIGALSIHGSEHLLYKLGTIKDANSLSELSAGRQALWTALVEAIPDFQMAGSGIGSHREIYPSYMQEYYAVEFTHGESGYLPLLLEAGAPGLALMLIGIVFALWWCIRPLLFRDEQSETRDRRVAVAGALLAGICVSAVHSAVDFVWYLSACMSVTVMLVAAACRLTALSLRDGGVVGAWRGLFMIRSSEFSRQTAVALFVGSCFVGGAMVKVGVGPALAAPHWNDYLRLALDDNVSASDSQAERLAEMHRSLSQALAHHPQSPRLNARMGLICLQRFEELQKSADNAMSLALIRDAAQASEFPSQESQNEWLSRAIGENRAFLDQGLVHSQRAVHECPLIGEAYVFLAELSFLETSAPAAKDEYIDQAQRVRPFDAFVQFSLGREALLALDVEKAIEHWKRAFHHDPQIRGQIV